MTRRQFWFAHNSEEDIALDVVTLAPLGENTNDQNQPADWPIFEQTDPGRQDHFGRRPGFEFAGTHLIVDLFEAEQLDDLQLMEATLRQAVNAAGATLLHIHLHHFTPNGGISGVAVLAESHISVHTWPERAYAAFDVFMCGDARPEATLPVLESAFRPARTAVTEHLRGRVNDEPTP